MKRIFLASIDTFTYIQYRQLQTKSTCDWYCCVDKHCWTIYVCRFSIRSECKPQSQIVTRYKIKSIFSFFLYWELNPIWELYNSLNGIAHKLLQISPPLFFKILFTTITFKQCILLVIFLLVTLIHTKRIQHVRWCAESIMRRKNYKIEHGSALLHSNISSGVK